MALDERIRDPFLERRWRERYGLTPDAPLTPGRCDSLGCTYALPDGDRLAIPRSLAALTEDCARADVLILRFAAPTRCPRPRLIIDRSMIGAGHGLSVTFTGRAAQIDSHAARCGTRPWCPDATRPAQRIFPPRRTRATPARPTAQ